MVQLAKGEVEEVTVKGHDRCLKVTSTQQGDRSVYLSFDSDTDYSKWLRKTKKVRGETQLTLATIDSTVTYYYHLVQRIPLQLIVHLLLENYQI